MALRPTSFSIPSTTELKISFSENLSGSISTDNFKIESLGGSIRDLEIIGLSIENNIITIRTRPQVVGNYYLLKMLDTSNSQFLSEKGSRLLDDSISRELFFIGIDDVNPIRDRMYRLVPDLFELEGSVLKNILSVHSKELYKAQKDIGSVLSNNYISQLVTDEYRVRSSGAFDRLRNENAFEVIRVGNKLSGESISTDTIEFSSKSAIPRMLKMPVNPISLQQVTVEDEIISIDTDNNSFSGFLINLSNKNVIKILSVLLIKSDETEDCNYDIGTYYDIERYKYAIKENKYDQDFSFKFNNLESNQILLSEFGNIAKPRINDRIIISYLYKDFGRNIIEDDISVTRIEQSISESVPSNATSFFLEHAPVVNSSNVIPSMGGLRFFVSENDTTSPSEFLYEVTYNSSRLPSSPGEWSCNYNTGEVFVFGSNDNILGTGRNNSIVNYNYRKEFKRDLDYSILNQDLVPTSGRDLSNKNASIFIKYDKVFARGVDYDVSSHIEVMPEFIENRLNTSFSITPKHTPVTDVFRILNQTTGEVYSPLYHSDSEIFFSGNRSPEIKVAEGEKSNFKSISNEKLSVIGEFISPTHTAKITSNSSNNNIQFSPGIPAELISQNSNQYFIREINLNDELEYEVEDLQIKFFGEPNSGGLISSVGINTTANKPSKGSSIIIGLRTLIIHLDNEGVLNKSKDALGSLVNTSFYPTDKNIFKRECYYQELNINPGLPSVADSSIRKVLTEDKGTFFYKNLSRIRLVGDYLVDYKYGIAYVAVMLDQDLDISYAHYSCASHETLNRNILTASSVSKKINVSDDLLNSSKIYSRFRNSVNEIIIDDMESGLTLYDGETLAVNDQDTLVNICEVQDDYTVIVPNNILAVNSMFKLSDLMGSNLNASVAADRVPEFYSFDLTTAAKDGGRNLWDSSFCTFNNNIIDLKKVVERRAYTNSNGDLELTILDQNAESFIRCIRSSTGLELFGEDLNIAKINNLEIVQVEESGENIIVYIDSSVSISDIDTDKDYLLDKNGSRFVIVSVDYIQSIITVESPSSNNIEVIEPELGSATIVVKPIITFNLNGINIIIPSDSGISNGEKLEITYLPIGTPDIGTYLAIDYRYGFHFFEYTYLNDEIVMWYEYGDNGLDWSISNALSEGQSYFVTYKFGALRSALRANFGALTDIPFFKNFPLEVDRELYRNALSGTLQAFPKGPTIPAFKELIKSFTAINPDISELSFGNWILGRDYAYPSDVSYNGVLNFSDGKFGSGLVYNDDVITYIPAISSLPLNEGTLECWVRPKWSGVANDATLRFELDDFGRKVEYINSKQNPFDNGYVIYPRATSIGGTDATGDGTSVFNFRLEDEELSVGKFGLYKNIDNLNQVTQNELRFTFKIDSFGLSLNNVINYNLFNAPEINISSSSIIDSDKTTGINISLTKVDGFNYKISLLDTTDEHIDNFNTPYQSKKCKCEILNNQSNLQNINNLSIKIDLLENIDIYDFIANYNIVTSDNSVLLIGDESGYFYQVLSLLDSNDREVSWENGVFSRIIIKKIAINNSYLTSLSYDKINDAFPVGKICLYFKTISPNIINVNKSNSAFGSRYGFIHNWSVYTEYIINREPLSNLINISVNNTSNTYFYTDFKNNESNLNGILFFADNDNVISEFSILKVKTSIQNIFSANDIYIGSLGYNPKSYNFSVNKEDSPNDPIGMPRNIEKDEGIFIWFDELCVNPFSDDAGQWIVRVRANRSVLIPTDVIVMGLNDYENVLTNKAIVKKISGNIYTDGEFGSVIRSHRDESSGGCSRGDICNATFRYCGNDLLESNGWYRIEETSSDLINVITSGSQTEKVKWSKNGLFSTSESKGIYRAGPSTSESACDIDILDNMLYTNLPCSGGDIEYSVSMRVISTPTLVNTDIGVFDGFITGNLNGITPIHINDGTMNLKLSLGTDHYGQNIIAVIDAETNGIVDIISYTWNDSLFHEYTVIKSDSLDIIKIYIDNILLAQLDVSDMSENITFDKSSILTQEFLSLYIVDTSIVNIEDLHNAGHNTVDIDMIFFSGRNSDGKPNLEDSDIFIHTDDRIEFSFSIDNLDISYNDGYDGYDGYGDLISVDEMFISSDTQRYIVDTGSGDSDRRFSIYKDGKGFLNFRIYDDSKLRNNDTAFFNVSTNIKNFVSGELHHIAASWKINSIDEKDEMHLFVDGQESSNIYRFGGKIPVAVNDKFSDISKESLQNFLVKDINYCNSFADGTTLATSSIFSSNSANFTDDMVGRSIIVTGSDLYDTLIGAQLIIASVIDNKSITLCTGNSFQRLIFNTSANDIEFKFAPVCGIDSNILTDLRSNRFIIKRTNQYGETEEIGGLLYTVNGSNISIIRGDNIYNPKFRANIDTRIIEFIGMDEDCNYFQTVFPNDLDVHIETLGLNLENYKLMLEVPNSTYSTSDDYTSGLSVLRTRSPEPIYTDDVSIVKIILPRTSLDILDPIEYNDYYISTFNLNIDSTYSMLSSQSGNVIKANNLGRLLRLNFESDNIKFCNYSLSENDGYSDGYQDGQIGTITIYGKTTDGTDEETFFVKRNGSFDGKKFFTEIHSVSGVIEVIDPDYFELGVIEIRELDSVTISNNNGDSCEISSYRNGAFTLSVNGSGGSFPFELHSGLYQIEYPTFLRIKLPNVGDRLYIGSNFSGDKQFGGTIDEFRIISELSLDTRVTEIGTNGTRSITEDFNSSIPFCPDPQTTSLIHFNNPIDKQLRRLRRLLFLNRNDNYSYKLSRWQIEELLPHINDREKFTEKMINMGFEHNDAFKSFYEAHKAEGGPIWNESNYYKNYSEYMISSSSINDLFNNSGYFNDKNHLNVLNDAGQFRPKEGTIEFWVSPLLDTTIDNKRRYYIDISSASESRIISKSSRIIELPNKAKTILSIKLLNSSRRLERYYTSSESSDILFDEIYRSDISGLLTGGTGSDKDFSTGASLSPDGAKIVLGSPLPGENIDVIVTYIPVDASGDRISVFKDENSYLTFVITANGVDHIVNKKINWTKNSWHRVMCTYKTNSGGYDSIKIFVDGEEGGIIRYGQGILYGTGFSYGQYAQRNGQKKNIEYKINLSNDLKVITIGADIFGYNNLNGRMDNLRFSRIVREAIRDSAGNYIDPNYSSNLNTVNPVINDDATTYINDFDTEAIIIDKFATVIDPHSGIFEFDLLIYDDFDRVIGINNGDIEELILDLVDRLKPAHSNATVKFKKNRC